MHHHILMPVPLSQTMNIKITEHPRLMRHIHRISSVMKENCENGEKILKRGREIEVAGKSHKEGEKKNSGTKELG